MVRTLAPHQQKLAEKLTVLNDRGLGLLSRVYNIKKACADAKSKPAFLSDKALESALKHIVRKFPQIDSGVSAGGGGGGSGAAKSAEGSDRSSGHGSSSNSSAGSGGGSAGGGSGSGSGGGGGTNSRHYTSSGTLGPVYQIRSDITKSLSLYYHTFVDVLTFRDHVSELLTLMDACQLTLDITVNFDLTKSYLDLVVTYVSLMLLLSRVDDRKAVLGLYNSAYEMINGGCDQSFPRLGQMIIDYDPPMKRLSDEFIPHAKLLYNALISLYQTFVMRNMTAEEWRKSQILSLVHQPGQMLNPAQTDTIQCEFISIDSMERYILFGYMLIHQHLGQSTQGQEMFQKALQCGWVTPIYRDEVVLTHPFVQTFFEGIKGYSKRIGEVKESHTWVLSNATNIHRERRKFLRTALKELALILTDQPGLLGPKILLVLMGLSFARDEVCWLLRHLDNPPSSKGGGSRTLKGTAHLEDLLDRQLPELLFHMEELRALVRKYNQVIQRYFVQYMTGFDAIALKQILQNIPMLGEEETVILESAYGTISQLTVKQVEEGMTFNFRDLRLDWFRLVAYTSVARGNPTYIFEHRDLAILMNTISFHSKCIDGVDELLTIVSDLSIFAFYAKLFEDSFHMCLEFPAQTRYIIAFPLICSHFITCTHELCPEERHHIGDRALNAVNGFLDEMSKEAKNIITTICDEMCILSDKLLPKHVAPQIAQVVSKKKGGAAGSGKGSKNRDSDRKGSSAGMGPGGPGNGPSGMGDPLSYRPGQESYRRSREELTTMDKLHMALTELCHAINYCSLIHVWDHAFAPREYLTQHLESRFNKALVGMVMFNPETSEIAKPSELLNSVKSYMSVLQSIESVVHLDITRVFNSVLIQQTQALDCHGDSTITALYTNWYLEVLLRRVTAGQIVYSPMQRAFVSLTIDSQVPFQAEEFSDVNELRSLAELIGPYGVKHLTESLMWHISSQVLELKKLVVANKEILLQLRSNYDKPEQMKELYKKLQHVDMVLQRMTLIGVILNFRNILHEALHDILDERIPFLISSVDDFKPLYTTGTGDVIHPTSAAYYALHDVTPGKIQLLSEMASGCGLPCKIDPYLVNTLRSHKNSEMVEDEYQVACLLMVFIAVSLPKLARSEGSYFKPGLEAHANNIHCLASSINAIAAALFTICDRGDIEDRLKEFLALASSSLLRLGAEQDREAVRNRESVYLLLDMIVQESSFLTMDLLESCFPYALLRNAYHAVYKTDSNSHHPHVSHPVSS